MLSASAKTLAEAEDLYASRNLDAAQERLPEGAGATGRESGARQGVLWIGADCGARSDPELAEKLFQKTLEMSPDDETKSWAYLYLGRLSDAAGEREQAEKHYRAALAMHGAPEQVKAAAEKGLAQPFQR